MDEIVRKPNVSAKIPVFRCVSSVKSPPFDAEFNSASNITNQRANTSPGTDISRKYSNPLLTFLTCRKGKDKLFFIGTSFRFFCNKYEYTYNRIRNPYNSPKTIKS